MSNLIDLQTILLMRRNGANAGPVSVKDIVSDYMSRPVPDTLVQCAYLALTKSQIEELSEEPLADAQISELLLGGMAINNFITNHIIEDHPTDKRFLLRYTEQLCIRYGLKSHKVPGFQHDLLYSVEPLSSGYTKFDNSLYIPPLSGYWAIAAKGSARD